MSTLIGRKFVAKASGTFTPPDAFAKGPANYFLSQILM